MPSNYKANSARLVQFKEELFIPTYCRHMGKSLAYALLDHVVSDNFLSQTFNIDDMRLLNMEKLSRAEYTVGFFVDNRFKIKVWLVHIAMRSSSDDAMGYAKENIDSFSVLDATKEDMMAVIGFGDKTNPHYEAIGDAATKFVAITLANGFNEFNSKELSRMAI